MVYFFAFRMSNVLFLHGDFEKHTCTIELVKHKKQSQILLLCSWKWNLSGFFIFFYFFYFWKGDILLFPQIPAAVWYQ